MERWVKFFCLGCTCLLLVGVKGSYAQQTDIFLTDGLPPVYAPASTNLPSHDPAYAEILERLERAESALQALQTNLPPPEEAELSSSKTEDLTPSGRPLGDYWRNVRDPAIIDASQQVGKWNFCPPTDMFDEAEGESDEEESKWYDKISIRGYTQVRINEVTSRNRGLAAPHHVGDSSVGDRAGFLIRRARLVFSGDISDRLYIYIQPDFASSISGGSDSTYYAQLRDAYADVYLDLDKVHRIRVGQSKVPYGWENLQSSSNRIPLDRADGPNNSFRNERDLGVTYYWTPEYAQDFFANVMDLGLKGSGNYGMFGLGIVNGQGGSSVEHNENLLVVSRFTLPVIFESGQMAEFGIQGYSGDYMVLGAPIHPLGTGGSAVPLNTLENRLDGGVRDERVGASFMWYPQPFGIQAEWNVGRGPSLDPTQTEIVRRSLSGGYIMGMYKLETEHYGEFFPFARYSHFQGGYKTQRNAPYSYIDEFELGCEWQITPQMELTTMYTFTDRTNTVDTNRFGEIPYRQFEGQMLRFQFQFNY